MNETPEPEEQEQEAEEETVTIDAPFADGEEASTVDVPLGYERGIPERAGKGWKPGAVVGGRYLIVRRIGIGGMGVVAEAEDLLLRRKVALKALRPRSADDPINIERFRKEVALAHTVTHPNVVRIYDLGEDDGVHYFSMEYLDGEPLSQRLKRDEKLPLDEVRRIGERICRALHAAHEVNVVHRDLKPSNIMLTGHRRAVVVMDFGISRMVDEPVPEPSRDPYKELTSWDVTSLGMGTPKYMSPEQWLHEPCGPPSDMYSLGAILFQCLTGKPPFDRGSADAFALSHVDEEPPRIRDIDPSLPKDLDKAIDRCLEKKPEDRYQSAADLGDTLAHRYPLPRWLTFVIRAVAAAVVLTALGWGVLELAQRAIIVEMQPAVTRLAQLAAIGVSAEDLDQIRDGDSVNLPVFEEVRGHLVDLHAANPDVTSLYTLRRLDEVNSWQFVVDRDPFPEDLNRDGELQGRELAAMPGQPYDSTGIPGMEEALRTGGPVADDHFIADEFGLTLSGYVRIGDEAGPGGYILGVDVAHNRLSTFRNVIIVLCVLAWPVVLALPKMLEWLAERRRRARAGLAARG